MAGGLPSSSRLPSRVKWHLFFLVSSNEPITTAFRTTNASYCLQDMTKACSVGLSATMTSWKWSIIPATVSWGLLSAYTTSAAFRDVFSISFLANILAAGAACGLQWFGLLYVPGAPSSLRAIACVNVHARLVPFYRRRLSQFRTLWLRGTSRELEQVRLSNGRYSASDVNDANL